MKSNVLNRPVELSFIKTLTIYTNLLENERNPKKLISKIILIKIYF